MEDMWLNAGFKEGEGLPFFYPAYVPMNAVICAFSERYRLSDSSFQTPEILNRSFIDINDVLSRLIDGIQSFLNPLKLKSKIIENFTWNSWLNAILEVTGDSQIEFGRESRSRFYFNSTWNIDLPAKAIRQLYYGVNLLRFIVGSTNTVIGRTYANNGNTFSTPQAAFSDYLTHRYTDKEYIIGGPPARKYDRTTVTILWLDGEGFYCRGDSYYPFIKSITPFDFGTSISDSQIKLILNASELPSGTFSDFGIGLNVGLNLIPRDSNGNYDYKFTGYNNDRGLTETFGFGVTDAIEIADLAPNLQYYHNVDGIDFDHLWDNFES